MIDLHAHIVLDVMGRAGPYGPELTTAPDGRPLFRVGDYELHGVRYRGSAFMDLDVRLAGMDEHGIELQVLSPNPITYFHHIEAEFATEFCRWHNDAMAETVARRPDRLRGFAQVPIQSPSAAVSEMRRAVTDLGLVGPYIGTESVYALDAPEMDEFYAAAVALDVPVFIHPAPHGIDSPLADPRVRRFDLDLYLGFLYEETMAVASLIYGGVLDRHPALDVCISHGGGASMWLRGRMAIAARNRPWSPEVLRADGAFEERLRRLFFDNHLADPIAFQALIDVVGPEQVVNGTNFAGWDDVGHHDTHGFSTQFDENARRLLRLG